MLAAPRWNVLGGRDLVRPYRTRVMWNPGDDRCVAADVLTVGQAPSRHWLISGEIVRVRFYELESLRQALSVRKVSYLSWRPSLSGRARREGGT